MAASLTALDTQAGSARDRARRHGTRHVWLCPGGQSSPLGL